MDKNPFVSAVIPTHNRPELVCRAVRSVLNQTYTNLEVVVVVDGPDLTTVALLEDFQKPCLRIVALPENIGACEARNIGVCEAKGEWIAFLDDDDEWLPEKTTEQIALIYDDINFITSKSRVIDNNYDIIIPSAFPKKQENWSEYIYCNKGFFSPPTFLVKKELMLEVPFTKGLLSNEDTDWILRAKKQQKIHATWLNAVTAYCHYDEKGVYHISRNNSIENIYKWGIENCGTLLTPKSFSYYLLRVCLPCAKKENDVIKHVGRIFLLVLKMGKTDFRFWIIFIAFLSLSDKKRHFLRNLANRLSLIGRGLICRQ